MFKSVQQNPILNISIGAMTSGVWDTDWDSQGKSSFNFHFILVM